MKYLLVSFLLVIAACTPVEPIVETSTTDISAAKGNELFNTTITEIGFACATCHRTNSEEQLVGPGLQNVGTRVANYEPSQTAADYLNTSILHPNDFIVSGYPSSVMPQNYADLLSEADVNSLIAYLLTL